MSAVRGDHPKVDLLFLKFLDVFNLVAISLCPISSDPQIMFEGIRDVGYEGDIAIDDVSITKGKCKQDNSVANSGTPAFTSGMYTYTSTQTCSLIDTGTLTHTHIHTQTCKGMHVCMFSQVKSVVK